VEERGKLPIWRLSCLLLLLVAVPVVLSAGTDTHVDQYADALALCDDSNPGTLGYGWEWRNEDPEAWHTGGGPGSLCIDLQPGLISDGTTRNVLVRPVYVADFIIETRVRFEPLEYPQQAGLVIFGGGYPSHSLVLSRAYCELDGAARVGNGIRFSSSETSDEFTIETVARDWATLRLTKQGDQVAAHYSEDRVTWVPLGSHRFGFGSIKIGVFANGGSTEAEGTAACFQFFLYKSLGLGEEPLATGETAVEPDPSPGEGAELSLAATSDVEEQLIDYAVEYCSEYSSEYTPHPRIEIHHDVDSTANYGLVTGSGTRDDPLLIEGLCIGIEPGAFGIHIGGEAKWIRIADCLLVGSGGTAIRLDGAKNVWIENTIIRGFEYGIDVDGSSCYLQGNYFEECYTAVFLFHSQNNMIEANTIRECDVGVYLHSRSDGNTIRDNIVDAGAAVRIADRCDGNWVYRNDFLSGRATSDSLNHWVSTENEGNYWTHYSGKDLDGDGFGDEAYQLLGATYELDERPAMSPYHEVADE